VILTSQRSSAARREAKRRETDPMTATADTAMTFRERTLQLLPDGPRVALMRYLRGFRERRRQRRADIIFIGHPKSGSTWMRFQLSRLYQKKYGLDESVIPDVEILHSLNPAIPQLHMGAYNYVKVFVAGPAPAPELRDKAVVFIARHPLDVMVSLYFHIQKHALRERKLINDWPLDLSNTPMIEFIRTSNWGLRPLISFMNDCMRQHRALKRSMILPYETMREQPVEAVLAVAKLSGRPVSRAEAEEAAEFASFDNLRQAEVENRFNTTRLRAADPNDPDSFKVRRGKVFGYRDHFTEAELAELQAIIDAELDPEFGYGSDAA
jgi:hypothetical protein